MNTRDRGNRGEDKAAHYLVASGREIIARNYCIRGGEVDIIFRDADCTVFCEVKTRNQNRFGAPAEAVDRRKQARICKAALDFAYKNKSVDEKYRFDIIEVDNGRINHLRDAFEFIETS